jgi:hypothetical protein
MPPTIEGRIKPGTVVGCRYRWPYDSCHPDCWLPPHRGIVLHLDDPRAWADTLAFPGSTHPNGPPQEAVTAHVMKHMPGIGKKTIPILYKSPIPDDVLFVQWDTIVNVHPYEEEYNTWTIMRETRYREITNEADKVQ